MPNLSIVYVLTNPAMPGLVKIGRTDGDDVNPRVTQLYTTGVPFPFTVEFACRVPNPDEVEAALHHAFNPNRINPKREFFQIDPSQAIGILKLLHVEDATREVEQQASAVESIELEAADQYRTRRPNLNFEEMGIPVGSTLIFTKTGTTATVIAPKKVRLGEDGEETSLTAATRQLLGLDYSVAPGSYWRFQGKTVSEIYNDTYVLGEEA